MKNFQLQIPTKVFFGEGVLDKLGAEAAQIGRKALLVYGQGSIKRNGVYDKVTAQLAEAGIETVEHPGVKPNPVLSHAEEGVRLAAEGAADMIVAVGGGSVIDEAKAIALGARNAPPLWDFYTRKRTADDALPIIAVQTVPATSSEMNAASVLTNDGTKEKFSARATSLFPKAAFLDPTVTTGIPLRYTAYACTDILSHMMEGYFTTTAEWIPIQDGMVEGISRGVIEAMQRLLSDPKDLEARSAVMWAGALAWSGLLNAGVEGAALPNHMIEHPLSAHHDIAHGAGLSIVIPAWLRHMKPHISKRIVRFGRRILGASEQLEGLSEDAQADRVIEMLESWYRRIGTPVTFAEGGIVDPDIEALTEQALKLAEYWGIRGYSAEDVKSIYHLCGRA
ncbi:MAG TPA: iron-containing alcohol dehydrogenase [Sediminispirochaeta sp.]|nr:iron-containing alcohol dehydrogenase [Sediminispirochaeta sp.]